MIKKKNLEFNHMSNNAIRVIDMENRQKDTFIFYDNNRSILHQNHQFVKNKNHPIINIYSTNRINKFSKNNTEEFINLTKQFSFQVNRNRKNHLKHLLQQKRCSVDLSPKKALGKHCSICNVIIADGWYISVMDVRNNRVLNEVLNTINVCENDFRAVLKSI